MSFDEDTMRLIDQRIRAAQLKDRGWGTCSQRDTVGPGAQVVFDGSTVAMPVKVLGHVLMQAGDRCVLDRYGSDWIVVGSFSQLGLGAAEKFAFGPSPNETTTSGTFVDLVAMTPFQFDKVYDFTNIRIMTETAAYASTVPTSARWGLRLTPLDAGSSYTPVDLNMSYVSWTVANNHATGYGGQLLTGVPAGSYSCQVRWRRANGTGTVTVDTNDLYMIELEEKLPPYVPTL
jgi:hypothetical protein